MGKEEKGKGKGREEDDDDRRPPRRNDSDHHHERNESDSEHHHERNETEHHREGREQEDDDEEDIGKLQGSTADFDKVANGIEDKLAAFKQEFENKLAQKNLTEDQQELVLEHVGKKFMAIVDNANKKWEMFQ